MNQKWEEEFDPLDDAIKVIRSGLKEGGPEVDSAIVMAFVDKLLGPEDMEKVDQLIHTWTNWNSAYWNLYSGSLESDAPDPERSATRSDYFSDSGVSGARSERSGEVRPIELDVEVLRQDLTPNDPRQSGNSSSQSSIALAASLANRKLRWVLALSGAAVLIGIAAIQAVLLIRVQRQFAEVSKKVESQQEIIGRLDKAPEIYAFRDSAVCKRQFESFRERYGDNARVTLHALFDFGSRLVEEGNYAEGEQRLSAFLNQIAVLPAQEQAFFGREAHRHLISAARAQQHWSDAEDHARALLVHANPQYALSVRLELAGILLAQGKVADATLLCESAYNDAQKLYPQDQVVVGLLLQLEECYFLTRNYSQLLKVCEQVDLLLPDGRTQPRDWSDHQARFGIALCQTHRGYLSLSND